MKKLLKWAGLVLGGLVGLAVLALAVVYGVSEFHMRKTYNVAAMALVVPGDSETIARGRHIAITRGCNDCHGENLAGGTVIDAPPVARLFATNLTRGEGGVAAGYQDADWERAIRHGVRPDGKPLLFMPSHEFYPLSDADASALIAYLKSLPPVDNRPGKTRIGPVGRALYLAGQMHLLPAELIDHSAPRPAAPVAGATVEYGAYLATGCVGCHGDGYSGGKIPGAPPEFPIPTNITPDRQTGIGSWTEQEFFRSLREGKRPDGSEINPFMPWKNFSQMTDEEIRAIYLYLQSLPARPFGKR
ncbi:MAG: cytochrome c [Gemmatimonadetes bacterium]|nr:cytochrome c [Gemmatimonadota bacterium]